MTMVWTEAPLSAPSWAVAPDSHEVIGAFDPYLEWAERTDFVHLGGSRNWWVPLLVKLEGITVGDFAKQARGLESFIRVPQLFDPPPPELATFPYCTVFVLRESRNEERVRSLFKNVVAVEYGLPIVAADDRAPAKKESHGGARDSRPRQMQAGFGQDATRLPAQQEQQGLPLTPQQQWQQSPQQIAQILSNLLPWPPASALTGGVVVGVIDDAIAFANDRFQCRSGGVARTRFAGFWQQDVLAASTPMTPLGTGWTLTPGQIDALVLACTSASGYVDEDELYRRLQHQGVQRRITHGTHVMDLAAGFDPDDPAAATTHLVGVQLPRTVTRDISGSTLTPYALLGLVYMVWLARTSKGTPLPLVVNLSYATDHGAHDGTSMFQSAVDLMISVLNPPSRPTGQFAVVLPAGNSYLTRGHAQLQVPTGSTPALTWRVQPDDATPSFVEIWMPRQARGPRSSGVRISVRAPNGVASSAIGPGTTAMLSDATGVMARIEYDLAPVQPGGRSCIRIALEPTLRRTAAGPRAPSGDWRLEFSNTGAQAPLEAWIWRDDRPMGFPIVGRQSRFDDSIYEVLTYPSGAVNEVDNASPIKRAGAFNDMATGLNTIVVGGVRQSDRKIARYSGSGPTSAPGRVGPDVVASSEYSVSLHGVLAAGAMSGSRVAMNGTSVAAPDVTRLVAQRFLASAKGDRTSIRGLAGPLPGVANPNRSGAGMVAAAASAPLPARPGRLGNRLVP